MKIQGSLVEFIKLIQLRWFGHLKRMTEDRLPKKMNEWTLIGRKKRGRPKMT